MELRVDVEGYDRVVRALEEVPKQARFATAIAINRTLEEALAAGRAEIRSVMTVRVPEFVLPPRQLPKIARARKDKLEGVAALGYPDVQPRDTIGERREKMLRKFEYGGTKTADDEKFPIAIPTRAIRPSPATLVPRALYPVNLRLTPRKDASGATLPALRRGKVGTLRGELVKSKKQRAALQLEGIGGTYAIVDENGQLRFVFQRTGTGKRDTRLLWVFRQSIRIPRLLHFTELAGRIIDERFLANFDGAFALAQRTARHDAAAEVSPAWP